MAEKLGYGGHLKILWAVLNFVVILCPKIFVAKNYVKWASSRLAIFKLFWQKIESGIFCCHHATYLQSSQ